MPRTCRVAGASVQAIVGGSLIVLLSACRRDAGGPSQGVTRDSAGIAIVESAAPAWGAPTAWRVDSTPTFDVGGSESDTTRQFSVIRGVHRLANGTVAVLDAASSSVRFFDMQGTPVGRAGRRGSGPGEFPGEIRQSLSCGTDTVYVDARGKMLVFAAPGTYVRELTITPAVGRYAAPRQCAGNRWLALTQITLMPTTEGIHPDTVILARYDMDGRPQAVIDTFRNQDRTFQRSGGSGEEGMGYFATPYGTRLLTAMNPTWLATGRGDKLEITYRDTMNAVRRIARIAAPERPIASAELDRFRQFVTPKMNDDERRRFDEQLAGPNVPKRIPAFADLRFDADGNLWLREYDFADAVEFYDYVSAGRAGVFTRAIRPAERRWFVLDPSGRLLGDVALPPRFDVHQIGSDWILGVWRDPLDVEHVRMYRIKKP